MKLHTTHTDPAALPVGGSMHRGVITCHRDAPLDEVAATMKREGIHCIVVEGEGGGAWGVVSDLDLVAAATVRALGAQTAGGSAATPVVTVEPAESLERAAQLMTEHGISHLLVVDRPHGRPLGVLSTLDIAAALAREEER